MSQQVDTNQQPSQEVQQEPKVSDQPFTQTNITKSSSFTAPGGSIVQNSPQTTQLAQPNQGQPLVQDENKVEDVDLESDIKLHELEFIPKLAKGQVVRLALLLFNQNSHGRLVPRFKKVDHFYNNTERVGFIAPSDEELIKACVKRMGDMKIRFATVVLVYTTDNIGNLSYVKKDPNDPESPLVPSFRIMGWRFSTDKWSQVKRLFQYNDLSSLDLILTCTEENFQKFDFQVDPQQRLLNQFTGIDQIVSEAQELFDEKLDKMMGQRKTDDEIRVFLGQTPSMGAPVGNANASNPFGNQVATGPAKTENFENMVVQQTTQTPPQQGQQPTPAQTPPQGGDSGFKQPGS